MDAEKLTLSVEEFFRRVRAGEFMGDEVTIIPKPIVFTIKESQRDDWGFETDEWYVGDDDHALYEAYAEDVQHITVTKKETSG